MKIAVTAKNGAVDFECDLGEKILHAALRRTGNDVCRRSAL